MVKSANYVPTFNNASAMALADRLLKANTLLDCQRILRQTARRMPVNSGWRKEFRRLASAILSGKVSYPLFSADGNSKLPFYSFSAVPVLSCPGAGECAKFCYSLRAWRYPAAFCRQVYCSLMLKHNPRMITLAFVALPHGVKLRLYVDGDFDSVQTVRFWFNLIKYRPDIRVYGYSKSWDEIAAYGREAEYPANYKLNLSSGGIVRNVTESEMMSLPITRGRFVSVPVKRGDFYPEGKTGNIGFARYSLPLYHDAVRQSAREEFGKVFSCPGKCGECAGGETACGSDRFDGVTIAIGIH